MSAAETASIKCSSTHDGADPDVEARAFDAREEECPAIAVLREEELLLHRRITALAVARGGGLGVDTKSGASSHSDGLLRGIQGLHQRWLFHQQLSEARCVGSAFEAPGGRASHGNRGNGCLSAELSLPLLRPTGAPSSSDNAAGSCLRCWAMPWAPNGCRRRCLQRRQRCLQRITSGNYNAEIQRKP
jgi:hypothetical protein